MARPFSVFVTAVAGRQQMANPNLWYLFIGLFALAGAMNLYRGLRRTDARRSLSIGLGVSSLVWAASAGLSPPQAS